ncbi:glycosyltransferase [Litoribrevibacter albus]|uniref:Glycosyl transferase n=1 Tax=Litoribrevibacter albus TaxID=1473156 RepID=A0AA37W7U0_9GAMM|nr:glycosyltransferase [Litoribrevibacter albus]GLQ31753.1 glycosyl transferase [Litoribrevibacter albus]
MKTLLVIGYVWPEPKSSAAGSRMMQLLNGFQQAGYQIHYASPAELSPHAEDLSSYGITSSSIELNSSTFDEFLLELKPAAVMFDRFMMEEQFGWRVEKHCPDALRILDTEDLHCLRHARHQAYKDGASIQETLNISNELLYSDLAKREIASILRCDLSLMISEAEMTLLVERFNVPSEILHYIPFFRPSPEQTQWLSFEARQHFISIGNFRHEPNWDAVRYLKESIWPNIRKKLPEAELHVYGAYPPKKATQLHNEKQGFLVKGWAEDAIEVVSKAKVLLAPLRFGAGLKGKLVDAAECGTPAVTTSIGAEGMYQNHVPVLVQDIADTFTESAISLYQDQGQWVTLQNQCAPMIKERFDENCHIHAFLHRLADVEQNLNHYRLSNFTGAMMRHHSMKSTQYMAQWIEAKNKRS